MDRFKNIEHIAEYDINMPLAEKRLPGLSAMLRVKDEGEYLRRSVESIIDWMDEVVICVQGEQSDGTGVLSCALANEHPDKVRVYFYPFDSFPNGPGHDRQPRNSVYERAYFYNWCLAKTTRQYVCKWDGDMIAIDGIGWEIRKCLPDFDVIYLTGAEMVSETHHSVKPYTATDPRIFRVAEHTRYETGPYCEQFKNDYTQARSRFFKGHQFLHFKWAKSMDSITKAWPDNWQEIPHFQGLMERKQKGRKYA